jgi:hypothetical protein
LVEQMNEKKARQEMERAAEDHDTERVKAERRVLADRVENLGRPPRAVQSQDEPEVTGEDGSSFSPEEIHAAQLLLAGPGGMGGMGGMDPSLAYGGYYPGQDQMNPHIQQQMFMQQQQQQQAFLHQQAMQQQQLAHEEQLRVIKSNAEMEAAAVNMRAKASEQEWRERERERLLAEEDRRMQMQPKPNSIPIPVSSSPNQGQGQGQDRGRGREPIPPLMTKPVRSPTKARMRLISDVYGSAAFSEQSGHGEKVNAYDEHQRSPERGSMPSGYGQQYDEQEGAGSPGSPRQGPVDWKPTHKFKSFNNRSMVEEQKRQLQDQIAERARAREEEKRLEQEKEAIEERRVRAEIQVMTDDENRVKEIKEAFVAEDFKKVKELQMKQYKEAMVRRGRRQKIVEQLSPRSPDENPSRVGGANNSSPTGDRGDAFSEASSDRGDPFDPYGKPPSKRTSPERGGALFKSVSPVASKSNLQLNLPAMPRAPVPATNFQNLPIWQSHMLMQHQHVVGNPLAALGHVPMQQQLGGGGQLPPIGVARVRGGPAGGGAGRQLPGHPHNPWEGQISPLNLSPNAQQQAQVHSGHYAKLPFTPVDAQFPSDSRLMPIAPTAVQGILGAFGMGEMDKIERAQNPGVHFMNVMTGGPSKGQPKTRLNGFNPRGEPTFERSLASDSLLLYLGPKPRTPMAVHEEVPDRYEESLGMKPRAANHHDNLRRGALSPSNGEKEDAMEAALWENGISPRFAQ